MLREGKEVKKNFQYSLSIGGLNIELKYMAQTKTDVVAVVGDIFDKAPALPVNAREALVKVTPWLALIFGVLGVLAGIGSLGLSPLAMFGGARVGMLFMASGVLAIVASVMLLLAYPKLAKKQKGGWMLLFWVEAVDLLSMLVVFNLVGFVIGGLIGFYLLYQIKPYYK